MLKTATHGAMARDDSENIKKYKWNLRTSVWMTNK